jgi:hypothetical protein
LIVKVPGSNLYFSLSNKMRSRGYPLLILQKKPRTGISTFGYFCYAYTYMQPRNIILLMMTQLEKLQAFWLSGRHEKAEIGRRQNHLLKSRVAADCATSHMLDLLCSAPCVALGHSPLLHATDKTCCAFISLYKCNSLQHRCFDPRRVAMMDDY